MEKINFGKFDLRGHLFEFVNKKYNAYREPYRIGVPKGSKIGFSKEKYLMVLLSLTNISLKDQSKLSNTSYGTIRVWNTQIDFKSNSDFLKKEFAIQIVNNYKILIESEDDTKYHKLNEYYNKNEKYFIEMKYFDSSLRDLILMHFEVLNKVGGNTLSVTGSYFLYRIVQNLFYFDHYGPLPTKFDHERDGLKATSEKSDQLTKSKKDQLN